MTASDSLSLEIDQEAGAAYLQFNDNSVERTEEFSHDILVDLDEHSMVVGIEILNLSKSVDLDSIAERYHVRTESLAVLLSALRSSAPTRQVGTHTPGTEGRRFGVVQVSDKLSAV